MKRFTLPSTLSELASYTKKAIQHFQGSPVTNEKKLEDSMAKGLDFRSRQQMNAAAETAPVNTTPCITPFSDKLTEAFRNMEESDLNSIQNNITEAFGIKLSREDARTLTAKVLGFNGFDNFMSHLEERHRDEDEVEMIEHRFYSSSEMSIKGEDIDQQVFNNEDVGYEILDIDDEISDLYRQIGEGSSEKTALIEFQEQLKELKELGDSYVFNSTSWSYDVVSPRRDTEEFNKICEDIVEYNKEYIEE